MSLCYTSKTQLYVGFNTFFIVLLHSSFIFPMFLPYASFCSASYPKHMKHIFTSDVGKNQMFQISGKQRGYREDGFYYLPTLPKTQHWSWKRNSLKRWDQPLKGTPRHRWYREKGAGFGSKGCHEMHKWIKGGGSFQLVFQWIFVDLGKSSARTVLK